MADKKITQLNELLVAGASDVFAIVDLTSNETKKITVSNLMGTPGPIGVDTPSSGEFATLDLSAGETVSEISSDSTADEVYQLLTASAIQQAIQAGGGGGSINSSSNNRMARYDGTDAIQGTGITVDDSDNITGVTSYSIGSDNAMRFPIDNTNLAIGPSAGNALTTGAGGNIAIGDDSMLYNETGDHNVAIGKDAGRGLGTQSYSYATYVGREAGYSATTGNINVCIGYRAGYKITTGAGNIFISSQANTQTGNYNTVVGYQAGIGTAANSFANNVLIGYGSGYATTTGGNNTFVGNQSGYRNETGGYNVVIGGQAGYGVAANSYTYNTFVGYQSAYSVTTGSNNVIMGYYSAYNNQTGASNVVIGYQAARGVAANSFSDNVFIGYQSAYSITTGSKNIFMGHSAGYSTTTGGFNIYMGYQTGYWNQTGANNVAIGYQAGVSSSGQNHSFGTFVGYWAGIGITTGGWNTLMGAQAGEFNTSGANNTAIGSEAGRYNETGQANVIVGREAGHGVTGQNNSFNTFVGYQAGYSVTTSGNNTLIGHQAGYAITTGNTNSFLGYNAGHDTSTGAGNVYIGYSAGRYTVSGGSNVCVGRDAGRGVAANSFNNNVFIGWRSGYAATTGGFNVAVGSEAGQANQTGVSNVFIGRQAGYNETGSNRLYIQNLGSADPLIYGEFDNNLVKINGDLDITGEFTFDTTGIAVSEISDDSTASEIYQLLTASAIQQSVQNPFRGYISRSQFIYKDADEIYINSGVYHHSGTVEQIVYWDSQLTKQLSGAGANTWYYLYLDDSAIVTAGTNLLTDTELIFSSTPPTWSDSKHGRYNGLDRCISAVLTDGSNNILQFFHYNDLVSFANSIEDLAETDISTTWTDVTLSIPDFCIGAEVIFRSENAAQAAQSLRYWRTNGLTGATHGTGDAGHLYGSTDPDGQGQQASTLKVVSDSSQIIEVVHDSAGTQTTSVDTSGWYFPVGM